MSIGKIKGSDKPVAQLIQSKGEEAKRYGIRLKEVFFTLGVIQVEGPSFHPHVRVIFEAPNPKAAGRFAKSLSPNVFNRSHVTVSRNATGMFWVNSEEELRSRVQERLHE